jgi:anti-anti-sigma regulatory factor
VTEGKISKGPRVRARVLRLPAILGIAQVADWRQRLAEALDSERPLTLDAAAVEQVDGAALQLLLAFQQAARQSGREPSWRNPSSPLHEAAALLGLDHDLGLPPLSPVSTQSQ